MAGREGSLAAKTPASATAREEFDGFGFSGSAPPPYSLEDAKHLKGDGDFTGTELQHVANSAFTSVLPLPDINFKDHFTKGLLAPKSSSACPFVCCGQPVAEGQLIYHTLRCSGGTALGMSQIQRFLVAQGFASDWHPQTLLSLSIDGYNKLTECAAQWHASLTASAARDGMRVHVVTPNDTLSGLVIHYGVSAQVIRHINRLPGDYIHAHASLLIPTTKDFHNRVSSVPTAAEVRCLAQREIVKLLQESTSGSTRHQIDREEAIILLAMTDFNLEEAVREFEAQKASSATPTTCLIESKGEGKEASKQTSCCTLS